MNAFETEEKGTQCPYRNEPEEIEMTKIEVNLQPRLFAQAVLESVCGEPSLVTESVISKFNQWLASGNKKESYQPCEIEKAASFIMGRGI